MLLNTSEAAGVGLFQKFFVQYFFTDNKKSFTPYYIARWQRRGKGVQGRGEGTTQKTTCKNKFIIFYEVNREEN